jgi:hypothetical protein
MRMKNLKKIIIRIQITLFNNLKMFSKILKQKIFKIQETILSIRLRKITINPLLLSTKAG